MNKYRITSLIILVIAALLAVLVVFDTDKPFSFGLDLSGGTHLVYEADVSGIPEADVAGRLDALRRVIERRVNSNNVAGVLGVLEPVVQIEEAQIGDEKRVIVELPGVTDIEQATAFIGTTPILEFKLLEPGVSLVELETATSTIDEHFIDTGLTGEFLESARMTFLQQQYGVGNEAIVELQFNDEGADLFEEITSENVGEILAIFLDGQIISAPQIQQAIGGGVAQISGGFVGQAGVEEARTLAESLQYGALPVPIELVSTQSVGASLGEEAREAGVMAGMIGLAIVGLFLIFWYRLPGVVAVLSLAIYLLMTLALFKLIPVVLTAAGIAGFILSIGMAVDANILIFERMKEELGCHGGDMHSAIREGFSRAWPSIRDGNISSIITAVILYWAGTTLTKGFAVTFGLGVLISMLSAVVISRTFIFAVSKERYEGSIKALFGIGFQKSSDKKGAE